MKKYIFECIGTMFLVLSYGFTENPIAIGSMLAVLIYLGRDISGGYYNPAVSLAMFIRGKIKLKELGNYVSFQLLGGFLAAIVYWLIAPKRYFPAPASWVGYWQIFLVEVIFTFFFCFVFLVIMTSRRFKDNSLYGIIIGISLITIMFLGATFNPAVSIGPSIFDLFFLGSAIKHMPAYVLGSLTGAVAAAYGYKQYNKCFKQNSSI